ncbi:hypothetical protein DRO35_02650, partial [Candidatus Bathyarchaeota archaeon]
MSGQAEEKIDYEIKYRPAYSLLEVHLPPGSVIRAEAGAMIYMSSNIEVKTHTRIREGGIWRTVKISLLGGETLFVNDYITKNKPGIVGFASAP